MKCINLYVKCYTIVLEEKHTNKKKDVDTNDVIEELTLYLDKCPFRDQEKEKDYKNSRNKAIRLFKEMSIENETADAIFKLFLHINERLNNTITFTEEMIKKYE